MTSGWGVEQVKGSGIHSLAPHSQTKVYRQSIYKAWPFNKKILLLSIFIAKTKKAITRILAPLFLYPSLSTSFSFYHISNSLPLSLFLFLLLSSLQLSSSFSLCHLSNSLPPSFSIISLTLFLFLFLSSL